MNHKSVGVPLSCRFFIRGFPPTNKNAARGYPHHLENSTDRPSICEIHIDAGRARGTALTDPITIDRLNYANTITLKLHTKLDVA